MRCNIILVCFVLIPTFDRMLLGCDSLRWDGFRILLGFYFRVVIDYVPVGGRTS